MSAETQVVKASELGDRVIERIIEVRYAAEIARYEKDLAAYERAINKGKKKELVKNGRDYAGRPTAENGFQVLRRNNGVMELDWVARPKEPKWKVFAWSPYDRSFGGFPSHASQTGVLAHPEINREINVRRFEEYRGMMKNGLWRDLLSDPISITEAGHVINGQHRLAAAAETDWDKVANDPLFLVIFGVDPEEAILADMSKRTARDQSTIATKVLAAR